MTSSSTSKPERIPSRLLLPLTLIVAAILFITINAIATNILGARQVDLTANKLYTISEGTKRTLASLEDTVHIRFYYSAEQATGFPAVQAFATRVRSLLQHYEVLSRGKVKVEVINPTPYSEVEDEAVKEGIQGIPVDSTGARLYLGMYASGGTEKSSSIAFFNPQRAAFLEYDLTKTIYDLSHPKKPVVTVISGLPMRFGMLRTPVQPDRDWAILTQMEEFFEMQYQNNDFIQIPKNTDVVMIIHPDKLTENNLLLIDQYLMEGGKAMIFTDPVAEVEGVRARSSNLNNILNAWGANTPVNEVVGDRSAAARLPSTSGQSLLDTVANLTWLEIQGWGFTHNDIITSDLGMVRFISAGHYVPLPATKTTSPSLERRTKWTPLITSTQDVTLLDAKKVENAADANAFMDQFQPIGKAQTLAVKITGKAPSAFPEKASLKGFLPYSQEDSTLILVADTDILRNGLWVSQQQLYDKMMYVPIADNGAFVMNTIDYLAGSRDLIALRSRSDTSKAFDVIQTLKRNAENKFRAKEEELDGRVKQAEAELERLKSYSTNSFTNLPNTAQRNEIIKFRERLIAMRNELREVRKQLHEDIFKLSAIISFLNIGLMPILVIIAALLVPYIRRRRAGRTA